MDLSETVGNDDIGVSVSIIAVYRRRIGIYIHVVMPDFISGITIVCNDTVTAQKIIGAAVGEDDQIVDLSLADHGISYASAYLIGIGSLSVVSIAGL